MKTLSIFVISLSMIGCSAVPYNTEEKFHTTIYNATYYFSLMNAERSEYANSQYGRQKIDAVMNNSKYQTYYEDDVVKILWGIGSRFISFSLLNKTDSTINISWDESAFLDERRATHRMIHGGVSYENRELPMAPSRVLKKSFFEDIVYPADYISMQGMIFGKPSGWNQKPLFLDTDIHPPFEDGTFPNLDEFHQAVSSNVGKTVQVMLPIKIGQMYNEYTFSFRVDSVAAIATKKDSRYQP